MVFKKMAELDERFKRAEATYERNLEENKIKQVANKEKKRKHEEWEDEREERVGGVSYTIYSSPPPRPSAPVLAHVIDGFFFFLTDHRSPDHHMIALSFAERLCCVFQWRMFSKKKKKRLGAGTKLWSKAEERAEWQVSKDSKERLQNEEGSGGTNNTYKQTWR